MNPRKSGWLVRVVGCAVAAACMLCIKPRAALAYTWTDLDTEVYVQYGAAGETIDDIKASGTVWSIFDMETRLDNTANKGATTGKQVIQTYKITDASHQTTMAPFYVITKPQSASSSQFGGMNPSVIWLKNQQFLTTNPLAFAAPTFSGQLSPKSFANGDGYAMSGYMDWFQSGITPLSLTTSLSSNSDNPGIYVSMRVGGGVNQADQNLVATTAAHDLTVPKITTALSWDTVDDGTYRKVRSAHTDINRINEGAGFKNRSGTWYFTVLWQARSSLIGYTGSYFRAYHQFLSGYPMNRNDEYGYTLNGNSKTFSPVGWVYKKSTGEWGLDTNATSVFTSPASISVVGIVYKVTADTGDGWAIAKPKVYMRNDDAEQIQNTITEETQTQTQQLKDTTGSGQILSGLTQGGTDGFNEKIGLLGQLDSVTDTYQAAFNASASSKVRFPGIEVMGQVIVPAQDVEIWQNGLAEWQEPCRMICTFCFVVVWVNGMKRVLDYQILGQPYDGTGEP